MKRLLLSCALLSAVILAGCDQLKEALTFDFSVDEVQFEFSTQVESVADAEGRAGSDLRAGEINPFSVTRTVSLNEIISSDLTEYKNKISKVEVTNSKFEITVIPSGNCSVSNLKIEAPGVTGSPMTVPSLSVGGEFTPPAGIDAFTSALIMKLITAGSVQVTISGVTDAPAGTTITIKYENNLTFTASLL